jgi:hypothetical protein
MKILNRLTYFDIPSFLNFGSQTVEVQSNQIVVSASISHLVFPAILDTGHSHNFTILEHHPKTWAGHGEPAETTDRR